MTYTIRWCSHDGNANETPGGNDLQCAIDVAQKLDKYYDGVEALNEMGRPAWPFHPEDADIR